jgi:geranylgeranyl pyrophosphate synthase
MQVKIYMQECLKRIETTLDRILPSANQTPELLHQAMRYSCMAGGKRIRPLMVYATGDALGLDKTLLDPLAAAVELIHSYSLIHDDLPDMDDDALRRGKPSCHIEFGAGIAILAGDALQALAFEVLANAQQIDPSIRVKLIAILAKASGSLGMVGGQAIDLAAQPSSMSAAQLTHMHRCKTGALIRASIQMAASLKPISQSTFQQLTLFAESLGLAFQIQDDILDIESTTEQLGKPQGSDQDANKATYPALLGLPGAKQWLEQLHEEALGILSHIDLDTGKLKQLTEFLITRKA